MQYSGHYSINTEKSDQFAVACIDKFVLQGFILLVILNIKDFSETVQ